MARPRFLSTRSTLVALGYVGVIAVVAVNNAPVRAQDAPPDVINLSGVIRDFLPSHPDFAITDPAVMGHYVRNVSPMLDSTERPVFIDTGQEVTSQWYDKDGNPIAPYAGPGLPGGHFDVDVYNEPSTNELFHEHQYDDKHNITYIDVVNNPLLEGSDFDTVIGSSYPNNLRMEFLNVHNGGGGTYTFDAGDGVLTGNTADGFTTTFDPALLTQLRVSFVALEALRPTKPGTSQGDAVDRDDSFHLRMFDVITDAMVYEVAVYHHFKKNEEIQDIPEGQEDACGVPINDTAGTYGSLGGGAITDAGSFDQWFRDELGTNQSTGHSIALQRDPEGVYEYMTDDFFPIDGQLQGNGGDPHNNYFTYTFAATFTYSECTSQFFEFESNDDAWVYIDDKLAIDLGGVPTPSKQYVALDRLGLVDGQEYTLNFFFAHRREAANSFFRMRTNLVLATADLPAVTGFYD
ncbi:MAG: fibro-slime domain-containing protein [Phycisphaerales bacterium]